MKGRAGFLILMAILVVGAILWYVFTVPSSGNLKLIGTVDADEVVVSSRIPGQIQSLDVEQGDHVHAGELVATIESQDLAAAAAAAQATAAGARFKVLEAQATLHQAAGQTVNQVASARAQLQVAEAALLQARANYRHQFVITSRTVALAKHGIESRQASQEAETSLQAAKAAMQGAVQSVSAAKAAVQVALANTNQAKAAAQTVAASREEMRNAQALLNQAQVELGYSQIVSPVTGIVNVRAARQGEVVSAGMPIITVVNLKQTWVYAPLPETQADAVEIGNKLRVVMPSGAALTGTVIAKLAVADFATQRDVSRKKRDIKTVQLKLAIPNPGMRYVPGMIAEVFIPKNKLVHP